MTISRKHKESIFRGLLNFYNKKDTIGHRPGVYRIKNLVNGKFYIGSSINMAHRWQTHKQTMRRNISCCQILQKAWNKYNEDKFVFEIIERVENKNLSKKQFKKHLLEKEQFYLDTLKPEYNILKIAGSTLGIRRSQEMKDKLSKSIKGHPYYGNKNIKPILQYDKNGNFIREWCNANRIHQQLGYHSSHIIECCKGNKRKTVHGYIWKYKPI